MIKSITIQNFGCFRNFDWTTHVRDGNDKPCHFKRLNILYGRNYSGKTTLSRILRCLETGVLPENYDSPHFAIGTDSGTISHSDISTNASPIRVYNRDFIDAHLGFLRDSNQNITPFAIIGSENNDIEAAIKGVEQTLGNAELKEGLRYSYAVKRAEFLEKKNSATQAETNLSSKITDKANREPDGIKHNKLYGNATYNAPKLRADIKTVQKNSIATLDDDEAIKRRDLLNEKSLPDLVASIQFESRIPALSKKTTKLVEKLIVPTEPLQALLDDAILQNWVKIGISLHRDKKDQCGFCGQGLPADLWEKLDRHFNKESEDLRKDLQDCILEIEDARKASDGILTTEPGSVYATLRPEFEGAAATLRTEVEKYRSTLMTLSTSVEERANDIFHSIVAPEVIDNTESIDASIAAIVDVIQRNNAKTSSLTGDQARARKELRLNDVAEFAKTIDFAGEEQKISDLAKQADSIGAEVNQIQDLIGGAEQKIADLQIELKDEKKGADKVNEYLNNYFGHEGLRLEAVEDQDGSAFKFQILRGSKPAYNLSEGECSLVSFCYFIAKLGDADSNLQDLTLYLDDPISSLDSDHIFFVFSLIEDLLAKPLEDGEGNPQFDADGKKTYCYEQMFIATHNLEFLKYLKRLSRPKKNHEQFLVIGNEESSVIELMPAYLRNYVTEFNFLFAEIYTCAEPANAAVKPDCFYNFGNNLRKFLEAFLFFKYPFSDNDKQDHNLRIERFFKDDPSTAPLVRRLTNEFSHLGGVFDRSSRPIDQAEISKLAKFVLKKIRDNDPAQFQCLLDSIGVSHPSGE